MRAREVEVREDRIVLRAEPVSYKLRKVPHPPARLLHPPYVAQIMHGPQIVVGRRLGRDERTLFQQPQRLAQLYGHPHPYRVERVVRAEPVSLQRRVMHKSRPAAHTVSNLTPSGTKPLNNSVSLS